MPETPAMPVPGSADPGPAAVDRRAAHPYLDPALPQTHPEVSRALERLYARIRDDDRAYEHYLDRMLNPPGQARGFEANRLTAAYYLHEAARYLDALRALFPRRRRAWRRPDPRVQEINDVRALLRMAVADEDELLAFEARRKLYVANLFFDVEHCWEVQRGDRHREFFAELIDHELHRHTTAHDEIDIAFNIAADGIGIDYRVGTARPNEENWRFHRRTLSLPRDGERIPVRVYFYSCRSKREVLPYHYVSGRQVYTIEAREKWTELSLRRDASIVSKLLRRGVNEPGAFPDIVGAMFIVEGIDEVEVLRDAIFDIVGGPMKIRNVVDTLTREGDRTLLNPQSGAGYKVYKGDLDVLYADPDSSDEPYGFVVELQLYTLESYLRTIHTRHYASHQRLKRRQFVEGLAPILFPDALYGRAPTSAKGRVVSTSNKLRVDPSSEQKQP
jgi:hypothetical protein